MSQELCKKLQFKAGNRVLLLNAPENVLSLMQSDACGVSVTTTVSGEDQDAVLLFAKDSNELKHFVPLAVGALQASGMLWVAYPKKSSAVISDLTRDNGWQAVSDLGYAPVRQVAVDATWSALRFKHASERTAPSRFGIDAPGIDRRARTVEIPEDLREALESVGLLETFEKLAFTYRKEHVLAIQEAKRPETRAMRIGKTIEMLMGQQLLGR
jgi:hypothetical protein